MRLSIPSNKRPFSLDVTVRTGKPQAIRVSAFNKDKPKTYYLYHKGLVNGQRTFELLFPKSANTTIIDIFNTKNGNFKGKEDKSFTASLKLKGLKTCPIWMSPETTEFVKFAQFFAENASILTSGDKVPHVYSSDSGKFHFSYFNKIRDRKTGNYVGTPARIGHTTGIVEISRRDFLLYTIPMRMIVLLHEYSHKFMNPKIGRPISDEVAADINALMLYLSLGYSPIEAHQAFLYVFKDANNKQNFKRYLIIRDFIKKFAKGEVNNCQITSKQVVQT
jgi:hypothetical protein